MTGVLSLSLSVFAHLKGSVLEDYLPTTNYLKGKTKWRRLLLLFLLGIINKCPVRLSSSSPFVEFPQDSAEIDCFIA